MRIIRQTNDLAAKVVLNAKDLTPVEGRAFWRLDQRRLGGLPEPVEAVLKQYRETEYKDIVQRQKKKGRRVHFDKFLEVLWFSRDSITPKENELAVVIVVGQPVAPRDESYLTPETKNSHEGVQQDPPVQDAIRETPLSTPTSEQGQPVDAGGLATRSKVQMEAAGTGLSSELKTTLKQKTDIQVVEQSSTPPRSSVLDPGDMVEFETKEGIIVKSGGIGMILIKYRLENITSAAENQDGRDEAPLT